MAEKYYLEETQMSFSYRTGPAGAVGAALGTHALGGIDFKVQVKIWTNHECKFDHSQPVLVLPSFKAGTGIKVASFQQLPVQWGHEAKKGCLDTYGDKDNWDTATVEAIWIVEDVIPLPVYTPFGFVTLPNPFTGQSTIHLVFEDLSQRTRKAHQVGRGFRRRCSTVRTLVRQQAHVAHPGRTF
jgi:hypothetical protein